MSTERPYGIMAQFASEHDLLKVATLAHAKGYRRMDAYTPLPIEGLAEAMGYDNKWQPALTLLGGLAGGIGTYAFQYWVSVIVYPMNIGGRPLHSWPSFMIASFELTILLAAFATIGGLLLLCDFPKPYHPVFNVPEFEKASQDGYFFCIEASDPQFEATEVKTFLNSFKPMGVYDVAE